MLRIPFLGGPGPVTGTSRFYVDIGVVGKAMFTELGGLQIETEIKEYAEGGLNEYVHRLPGRTKVGNLTLKRGMAQDDRLLRWYLKVVSGRIERHNVTVQVFGVDGSKLFRWDFKDAYPVKWIGPQLSASGNALAIDTLELAHSGLTSFLER